MTRLDIDNDRCERLIRKGAAGEAAACRELIEYLWPIWLTMLRSSRGMNRLVNPEDGIHDVVARLVEKLGQAEGRGLVLYLAWKQRNTDKAFEDWLRIVTKNTIRDYMRERIGTQSVSPGAISAKRLLNEFASSPLLDELGVRPPVTLAQTARELLEFARTRLAPEQVHVLEAWLKGASFEEIGAERAMSEELARQHLRAAVAVLRRYFSAKSDE